MAEDGSDLLLVVDGKGGYRGTLRFDQATGEARGKVADRMGQAGRVVRAGAEIRPTLEAMLRDRAIWMPVVDEEDRLKGVVTLTQFACFFAAGGREGSS